MTAVCLAGHLMLAAYARRASAVSSEAGEARKSACAVVESAEQSQVLFGREKDAISSLIALAAQCSNPDWDGNGAAAIDAAALDRVKEFVMCLPKGIPLPEFAPEPDGSVSLDWTVSRHRRLSLSVGAGHRLAYAWLDGADKGHGVARFDGASVPPRVLDAIRSIVSHADASIWPA